MEINHYGLVKGADGIMFGTFLLILRLSSRANNSSYLKRTFLIRFSLPTKGRGYSTVL